VKYDNQGLSLLCARSEPDERGAYRSSGLHGVVRLLRRPDEGGWRVVIKYGWGYYSRTPPPVLLKRLQQIVPAGLAVACAEESAEQAAGLAAAQGPPPEAEQVIAEYLADVPAAAAEKRRSRNGLNA
jgi:hypothetical protein